MSPYTDISKKELRSLFMQLSSLHILVVGDIIIDRYIWGSVHRISPEAPVPVIQITKKEYRLGGAGNVAANLAGLGTRVTLAGSCGDDGFETTIIALCEKAAIEPLLQTSAQRNTTLKSRIIAQHQQLLRIDEENCTPLLDSETNALFRMISHNSDRYDGIIISDYNKGLLTLAFTSDLIRHFHKKPLIVDPKSNDFTKYRGATALKPNRKEFANALRQPDLSDDEIEYYSKKLVADINLDGLVITLGEQGVFVLDNQQKSMLIPTKAREVFDVSGAGDTFIATFLAGLIISNDWFTAAKAANLASGVVVGKVGTATVTPAEIFAAYDL